MSRHNLSLLVAFVAICFIFSGAVVFSVRQGSADSKAAHQAASQFYTRLQAHDFAGAHSMLTRERQDALSPAMLSSTWSTFEKKHGVLMKWELADTPTVYGNRISLFPRYVEESRLLSGTKGKPGAGMLHLQPEDGQWKVGRLSIVP